MGTLETLVTIDHRIGEHFQKTFPESPEFATYLTERTVALGCSLLFARVLTDSLIRIFPSTRVSGESVGRFSVDTDQEAVGRMNAANPLGPYAIAFCTMCFLQRVSGDVRDPRVSSMERWKVVSHASIDASMEKKIAYVRLFSCALAMLRDGQTFPRGTQETHKEVSDVA